MINLKKFLKIFLIGILFLNIPSVVAAKITYVTITWTNPTTTVSGTPLTDLAGVTIYWGSCQEVDGSMTVGKVVGNINIAETGNINSYNVTPTGMTTFPICFYMTSYTSNGLVSSPSNTAEKNIPTIPTLSQPILIP